MTLSEHFHNASQGLECVNGCLMPRFTTHVLCVFHYIRMPQSSARTRFTPFAQIELHGTYTAAREWGVWSIRAEFHTTLKPKLSCRLLLWREPCCPLPKPRGLAVLWDKFHRKITLTSPPHRFSFGSPAQQSQYHTALPSVLSWLVSDCSRWLHVPGRSVAPVKHLLSPCALHGDSMPTTKFIFQFRAQAYRLCTATPNTAAFSVAFCIQAQLFPQKARKAPCMLLF